MHPDDSSQPETPEHQAPPHQPGEVYHPGTPATPETPEHTPQHTGHAHQHQTANATPFDSHGPSSPQKLVVSLGIIVVLVVAVVIWIAIASSNSATQAAKTNPAEVSITSTGFVPSTIRVKVGQAVVWTDNDTASHQVASDPYPKDNGLAGFNAQSSLSSGQTYSFVFDTTGTYTYHDDLHPYALKGSVVVVR